MYGDVGVDVAANGADWVYQAKDAAAATALVNAIVAQMQANGPVTESVPNLPGSACRKDTNKYSGNSEFTCEAARGRYEFCLFGNTLKDAQQKAAAQYLMLGAA